MSSIFDLARVREVQILHRDDGSHHAGVGDIERIEITSEPGQMAMVPGYAIYYHNGTVRTGIIGPQDEIQFGPEEQPCHVE